MNYNGVLAQTGVAAGAGAGMVGGVWAAFGVVSVILAGAAIMSLARRQKFMP